LLGSPYHSFVSPNISNSHKDSMPETSPKCSKERGPTSVHVANLPIRLLPLTPLQTVEAPPPRKSSLTDPNEPFLRLQISRKPCPPPQISPTTPPSASYLSARTRPCSLTNTTSPLQYSSYPRHTSATPSELSTLAPYMSNSTTPPSTCHSSYNIQNVSAWDEWDSEEEEKAGLVGYWKGRKWRGSRGSLGGASANGTAGEAKRDSCGRGEEGGREGKRRMRLVRVMSCGCGED